MAGVVMDTPDRPTGAALFYNILALGVTSNFNNPSYFLDDFYLCDTSGDEFQRLPR
jgi:hypothetical protein